jgi:transcriptional regulator with XRE-family HTH domain
MNIGILLKKFRKQTGKTQKDISQMTGISIRTIIRLENGGQTTKRTIKILQYEGVI